MTRLVVVSTTAGQIPAAIKCARSVAQEGLEHHFACADFRSFDVVLHEPAADGSLAVLSPAQKIDNLRLLICALPADTIVIWLDGDDHLLPGAGRVIREAYMDPDVWLTYGSFIRSDGVSDHTWHAPFGRRYHEKPRAEEWRASHLRTFRAGLFQSIPQRYLERQPGQVFTTCDDRAVMLPMIEMAGDRYRVIQDVLCEYRVDHDADMSTTERATETCDRLQIHGMAPLAPLKVRPW